MDKFCVNCKHYKDNLGVAWCTRSPKVDPVTGEYRYFLCAAERDTYNTQDYCGYEGVYFVERKE